MGEKNAPPTLFTTRKTLSWNIPFFGTFWQLLLIIPEKIKTEKCHTL